MKRKFFNKSFLTNFIALLVFILCSIFQPFLGSNILLNASLFAFSGSITNSLAIHMLFEKIPFVYGTGVITLHFEEFKVGIKNLIMDNFFTEEQFQKFSQEQFIEVPIEKIASKININPIFDELVKIVQKSPLGNIMTMMGQNNAIEQFREPFLNKIKEFIPQFIDQIDINSLLAEQELTQFSKRIDSLITEQLNELTPKMVKEIIENMIRKHLGWLVVWGGVFGGLIGMLSSLFI